MNKQEAMKKLTDAKRLFRPCWSNDHARDGFEEGINFALETVNKLDEPEKPVVPQFVADWLEVCKENLGFGLSTAMSHSTSAMKKQSNRVKGWFNLKDNQETFAKAWLFGYEVEKEKLYEVFLKRTGAQLCVCVPHVEDKTQFTKVELQEHGFNNLDVYEVKEVEDD